MSNMSNIGQNIPIFVFLTNMVICWFRDQIFPMYFTYKLPYESKD